MMLMVDFLLSLIHKIKGLKTLKQGLIYSRVDSVEVTFLVFHELN